jgi:hypothetical protein
VDIHCLNCMVVTTLSSLISVFSFFKMIRTTDPISLGDPPCRSPDDLLGASMFVRIGLV